MSAIVILENDGTVSYTMGATLPVAPLPIDFPFFFIDEIGVTRIEEDGQRLTLLTQAIDYTLATVAADDGFSSGSVTLLGGAFVAGSTIRIDRTLRSDKAHNFPETGAISIPGMNTLFSRLFSWIQDLNRKMGQVITDGLAGLYLPLAGGTLTGPVDGPAISATDLGAYRLLLDNPGGIAGQRRWLTTLLPDGAMTQQPVDDGGVPGPVSQIFHRDGTLAIAPPPPNDSSNLAVTSGWIIDLLGNRGQGEAIWRYDNGHIVDGDPGVGNFLFDTVAGVTREFAFSNTDADGLARYLLLLRPGDSIVFTNEFVPVVKYARYDLVSTVIDEGGYVRFSVHLSDQVNFEGTLGNGERLRVQGFLNTAAGANPITAVLTEAGSNLQGGGLAGTLSLSVVSSPAFAGTPTAPTPSSAATGTELVNAAWVRGRHSPILYDDRTLAVATNQMTITIPPGGTIKRLMLEMAWIIVGGAGDIVPVFQMMQGAVPVASPIYNSQILLAQAAAVNAGFVSGQTGWDLGSTSIHKSTLNVWLAGSQIFIEGTGFRGVVGGSPRLVELYGFDATIDTSTVTGFRVASPGNNFTVGSWMRTHVTG